MAEPEIAPRVVPLNPKLDPEVEERCAERLRIARTHMAAGLYHWVEAGKQFTEIKQDVRGAWAPWCQANAVARQTADALIHIAGRFANALLATSSSDALQIDFEALRLLASPSVPNDLAEEAMSRAAAGEHITKAEAQAMVDRAKTEAIVEQRKKIVVEIRASVAEEIADLESRITEDADERRALKKRIKELDEVVNGKRKPDLEDIERVLGRYTGKRKLSKLLVQSLAKEIGKSINYDGITFPAVDPAETRAHEDQILRNQALARALSYFSEAPEPYEMLQAMPPHHIKNVRTLAPIAIRWLQDMIKAMEKAGR